MKTVAFYIRVFSCVLALNAYGRPAGAQTDADRLRLDDIAREAAREVAAVNSPTLDQTRPTAPPPPGGTQVELTMDEATARALERNLDIAVERLNPQTFD